MGTQTTTATGHGNLAGLLARLVQILMNREPFETLADLTEALKGECARLKIRWTNDAISDAYRLIESNRPLLILPAPARGSRAAGHQTVQRGPDPHGGALSRDDARQILAGLGIRL
jgi:hypothetical protein